MTSAVPPRRRRALAVLLGLVAAGMSVRESISAGGPRDFGQVWYAARALLTGLNPYDVIGPGREFPFGAPLLYPLPAALVAIPVAPFPEIVASALLVALGAALFAWVLMRGGYGPLFGFFSMAVRAASGAGQWSMLLAASYGIPVLSVLLIVKPTMGAVLFVAKPRADALLGGVILVAVSLFLLTSWPLDWWHAIQRNDAAWSPMVPYRPLIAFPGGALALLALLRWRRPEARLVAALACVPITLGAYEMVPLFLIPRTFWQAAFLVGGSWAQEVAVRVCMPTPLLAYGDAEWVWGCSLVALQLLPATLLVLRRPNEMAA